MTNAEKAKAIVYHIAEKLREAKSYRIEKASAWAGECAGQKEWQRNEDKNDNIGWGGWANPYKPDIHFKKLEEATKAEMEWEEVHKYALDVFLEKIPDEEKPNA